MQRATGLTEEDLLRYERDGACLLRGMFDAHWIEGLARGVERVLADPSPMVRRNTPAGRPGLFLADFCMERRFEEFRAFVHESPAAELAARLMRSETAVFYHDHLLVKEPGTQERTLWHHDQPYWPVDGEQIVSLWLPLDPVPREVCPEWVRGSHRSGEWYAPRYFKDGEDLDARNAKLDPEFDELPDVDARREEFELLSWDVELGDCVAFHARTLHGAPGNPSEFRRRRAYATRWVGDDARWAERPGRTSPPIEDHGLRVGDALAGERFPRVWPPARP